MNRYGVFNSEAGESEFDRIVSQQRKKMLEIDGEGKDLLTDQEKEEASQALNHVLKSLSERQSLSMEGGGQVIEPSEDGQGLEDSAISALNASEDSSDKIPVKQPAKGPPYRTKINEAVDENADQFELYDIPGIVNLRAEVARQAAKKSAEEARAAQVIQKHYRGHKGRQQYRREKNKYRLHIDEEYEALNRELKASNDYNLKTYLAEKKKIRQATGFADSISEDMIPEVIGDSGSLSQHKARGTGGFGSGSSALPVNLHAIFHPR